MSEFMIRIIGQTEDGQQNAEIVDAQITDLRDLSSASQKSGVPANKLLLLATQLLPERAQVILEELDKKEPGTQIMHTKEQLTNLFHLLLVNGLETGIMLARVPSCHQPHIEHRSVE